MEQQQLLNRSIGIFVVLSIFGRSWLERELPEIHWCFVIAPLVFVTWAAAFAWRRIDNAPQGNVPAHRRLEAGDYFRVFFTLWAGYWALAETHLLGFWLFTCIAALLICSLITVLCVDLFLERKVTPLVVGCGLFIYFLLSWEHNVFVRHYGVPIIGHFFERPEYDARYYVDAERNGTGRAYRLAADIHVQWRSEEVEDGYDDSGSPISRTYSYRDVRVRRLHFPNGGSVAIYEQTEALTLDRPVFMTDTQGVKWYVKLLDESVH